ncbi:MAG: hypothetical protein DYG89_31290 [Caldilinea sp. CFX5]|nr:hypothetical protein [Caldilinea sp. CFX5]
MANSHPHSGAPSGPLSTYPLEKLIQLWRNEELTSEQMVGQRSAELTPKPAATCDPAGCARTGAAKGGATLAEERSIRAGLRIGKGR